MSQRKALIASLVITLVLALSAIGIRAAMVDSPDTAADSVGTLTLVQPGGEFDDDDSHEGSDEDAFAESHDDSDDDDNNSSTSSEDHEDEENGDDD